MLLTASFCLASRPSSIKLMMPKATRLKPASCKLSNLTMLLWFASIHPFSSCGNPSEAESSSTIYSRDWLAWLSASSLASLSFSTFPIFSYWWFSKNDHTGSVIKILLNPVWILSKVSAPRVRASITLSLWSFMRTTARLVAIEAHFALFEPRCGVPMKTTPIVCFFMAAIRGLRMTASLDSA